MYYLFAKFDYVSILQARHLFQVCSFARCLKLWNHRKLLRLYGKHTGCCVSDWHWLSLCLWSKLYWVLVTIVTKSCIICKSFCNLSLECAKSTTSSSEIRSDTVNWPNGLFLSQFFKTSSISSSGWWTCRESLFHHHGENLLIPISLPVFLSPFTALIFYG